MTLPLDGIHILHLSSAGPGPYCTMLLGDLGSDVIIVEEPVGIDRRARLGRPVEQLSERFTAYDPLRRNKRSITLNLKSEGGREVFYRLASTSDVVVEAFRPGVAGRLGVDYATLREINPRIVYCSITGYGQTGPYRDLAGHDINYIGVAGVLGLIGERDGPPVIPSNLIGDYGGGGMHAVMGILAALLVRERTGFGQYVDVSMTDCAASLMAQATGWAFESGIAPRRSTTMLRGSPSLPHYNVYETKDGKYISLGTLEPHLYPRLCQALGRDDFVEHQNNPDKYGEMFAFFRETFKTKTRGEWFEYLRQFDQCVAPVNDFDEAFEDPHMRARDMVVEVEHPTFGKVKQLGISVRLSETPGAIRSLGAVRGRHTDEILRGLGYGEDEIRDFREQGAV